MNKQLWVAAAAYLVANVAPVAATEAGVSMKFRYQEAKTLETKQGVNRVAIPDSRGFKASDERLAKTIFVAKMGNVLDASLKKYAQVCKVDMPKPRPRPLPRPFPQPRPLPVKPITGPAPILPPDFPKPPVIKEDHCKEARVSLAEDLLKQVDALNLEASKSSDLSSDVLVFETLDLVRKLAKNMKEAKFHGGFGLEKDFGGPRVGGGIRALATAGGAGLSLTGGGAQDFAFVKKTIEDGRVPQGDALSLEGFMSEFDLSLTPKDCNELICIRPEVAFDGANDKLFVQVAMNSNVTKETFKRNPLNLSIVLDISGSMSAKDNTEKSRLEWAKDALVKTVEELNEEDYLSIVLFDTKSELLVPTTRVNDKKAIIEKVMGLKTKGSTNLEAGLRDGYELLSDNLFNVEGYDSRVILISDAGLNTGSTAQEDLLKLVTDFANENIGLTAIGLGLNFNNDFINGIAQSKGGNYVFVHSGKDMFRYFNSFDFLVTPVAYNFKASLQVEGMNAELVKTYGVPMKKDAEVQELIDIQTLFFSEAGGAILLEYDLK